MELCTQTLEGYSVETEDHILVFNLYLFAEHCVTYNFNADIALVHIGNCLPMRVHECGMN